MGTIQNGRRRTLLVAAASAASAVASTWPAAARAQAAGYPNRPIHFILPFPPGGGTELSARYIGKKLTELCGQPVIVESRGGGNGFIGVHGALSAAPDGYTVFFGSSATLASNVALFRQLPYDPVADFTPVSLIIQSPIVFLTSKQSPYASLRSVVAAAKASPGKITIGTGSTGYLLMAELFAQRASIKYTNIPYKSAAETVSAIVGLQVDVGVVDITSAMPLIQGGLARPLAVASERRNVGLPNAPTVAEEGIADFNAAPWNAVAVSSKVPMDIADKLSGWITQILGMPETKAFFDQQYVEILKGGRTEMKRFQLEEIEKWKKIALDAHVPQQ